MIPLRDSTPSFRRPTIGYALIGLNALIFLMEMAMGPQLKDFVQIFGFVPRNFLLYLNRGDLPASFIPIFTSMFLHGGWLHLIANMWTLYIFGDNVEDTLGHVKFIVLYLASGAIACFAQLLSAPGSSMPMVGASGAIAGIMGAYFSLFPRAKVLTLVPVLFFVIIEIPAYVFLGLWFILQFFAGTFSILGRTHVGVAFWAHVGGFAAGWVLIRILAPGRSVSPFKTRAPG
jgi:membrane associated rhomboid family serine protease